MRKPLLILSLLLGFSASFAETTLLLNGQAAEAVPSRAILNGDGSISLYFSDGTTASYDMNRVSVVDGEVELGLENILQKEIYAIKGLVGDQLLVEGLQGGERILLFAPDGRLLLSQVAEGPQSSLDLKATPAGCYLLRVNSQIFKFNKQ